MHSKELMIKSVGNFRDLSGMEASDGRLIQCRKLFRSGHLNNLSEVDSRVLKSLDIRQIYDLRRTTETVEFPTKLRFPVMIKNYGLDIASLQSVREEAKKGTLTKQYTRVLMIDGYRSILNRAKKQFSMILKLMATNRDGAVLIHCMAGKDRTGVLVALILYALNVPRHIIIEDYAQSSHHFIAEKEAQLMADDIIGNGGKCEEVEIFYPICKSDPDYIASFLNGIDYDYNGIEAYLQYVLEIKEAEIHQLRNNLLS